MTYNLSTAAAVGGLAAILLAPGVSLGQGPTVKGAAPDEVVIWNKTCNLDRLSQDPFKRIIQKESVVDPTGPQVRFLVEFTRPITLAEAIDWQKADGPPVVFRFLDADGVVIQTVKPRWEGEMVSKKGSRLRIVLPMPEERTLALTRSIVAD
jgi:hypothetical protein